jgi:hypothetical protein
MYRFDHSSQNYPIAAADRRKRMIVMRNSPAAHYEIISICRRARTDLE